VLGTSARLGLFRRLRIVAVAWFTVGSVHAETPENAAPRVIGLLPLAYDRPELVVKAGTKLELTLVAEDPEGDPLAVHALGLPPGAVFDPALRRLSWSPTLVQAGVHVVVLSVSDGRKEATRALSLTVVRNRAPVFFRRAYTLGVGQFGRVAFAADDTDGDALTYRLLNPPQGAIFDPVQGLLQWRPDAKAVGQHRFRVSVSDGLAEVTDEFEVEVSPPIEDAWATFLQPGVGPVFYFPRNADVGSFAGGTYHVSLLSWIHRTSAPGPAYGRVYLGAEFLSNTENGVTPLFGYMFGFDLSFERNPSRRVLIPTYGVEAGGMVHQQLGKPFQITPFGGLVLFANRTVAVSARGGYRCVPTRFAELSGAYAALIVDAHAW